MVAIAVATILLSPASAEERRLGEGEAFLVSPDGTMYRSNARVEDRNHEAALARGAFEVPRGTVFYRHGGKLCGMNCAGTSIGDWEHGYPGQDNLC